MTLIKSYWTVKGISAAARDAATRAAEAEGAELGDWLTRLIGKVAEEERRAAAAKEPVIDTAAETAAETVEESADAADDPVEETADDTPEDVDDGPDEIKADKLSSIERAMLHGRAASDA